MATAAVAALLAAAPAATAADPSQPQVQAPATAASSAPTFVPTGSGTGATGTGAPAPAATSASASSAPSPPAPSNLSVILYPYIPLYGFGIPMAEIFPIGSHGPAFLRLDRTVAHDMHGGIPPPTQHFQVILRDGVTLQALHEPKLAGGTVRYTDLRGTLVSVRASEVDLPATAAANHLDWQVPGAPPSAAARAAQPSAAAPPLPATPATPAATQPPPGTHPHPAAKP